MCCCVPCGKKSLDNFTSLFNKVKFQNPNPDVCDAYLECMKICVEDIVFHYSPCTKGNTLQLGKLRFRANATFKIAGLNIFQSISHLKP